MLYFENDYSEGAHEKILQRLIETNMEHLPGYGNDKYCTKLIPSLIDVSRYQLQVLA